MVNRFFKRKKEKSIINFKYFYTHDKIFFKQQQLVNDDTSIVKEECYNIEQIITSPDFIILTEDSFTKSEEYLLLEALYKINTSGATKLINKIYNMLDEGRYIDD